MRTNQTTRTTTNRRSRNNSNQTEFEQAYQEEQAGHSRWTPDEDATLLRYIEARPQNLHYCFMMVAEQIGRTPLAVSAHWYSVLSKKPEAMVFFTASKHHIARNRKNGLGVESNGNIWRRLLAIIRNIC